MSLFVKVRCGNCGGMFDLYHKAMQKDTPARCPHCNIAMSEKQWNGLVNAYHCLQDWNTQTAKSHIEHGAPAFCAEIRRHFVPVHKYHYV